MPPARIMALAVLALTRKGPSSCFELMARIIHPAPGRVCYHLVSPGSIIPLDFGSSERSIQISPTVSRPRLSQAAILRSDTTRVSGYPPVV